MPGKSITHHLSQTSRYTRVSKNGSPLYQNITKWIHFETHAPTSKLGMNYVRIRKRNRKSKVNT